MSLTLRRSQKRTPLQKIEGQGQGQDSSEMEESDSFGSPHPLLIPHIASEIFSYLSFSKLKTCRLVCKTWKDSTSKLFHKRALVVLDSYRVMSEFLDSYDDENKPSFCNFKFTSDLNPLSGTMFEFLDQFGASVTKYVHFEKIDFTVDNKCSIGLVLAKIQAVEDIVLDCRGIPIGQVDDYTISPTLLNLKSLRCGGCFETDDQMENFAKAIMHAFLRSPKFEKMSTILDGEKNKMYNFPYRQFLPSLSNLQIPSRPHQNSVMSDVTIGIVLARSSIPLKQFSHLETIFPARRSILEWMCKRELRFKTLRFCTTTHINGEEMNRQSHEAVRRETQEFFGNNAGHLVTLMLTLGTISSTKGVIGDHNFSALKNLAIHGGFSPNQLSFINGCPALETLHFVESHLPTQFENLMIDTPLRKLKTFVGHKVSVHGRRSPSSVLTTKICSEFLQLRKLKLDKVKDASLDLIFKKLTQLEELAILNSLATDTGITGFSKAILTGKNGNNSKKGQAPAKSGPSRRLSYIGDLTNLRRLEIGSSELTDASVYHGILDCHVLKSLTIYSPKITGKCLKRIVDEMDLLALRTICCYGISDSALEYARIKLNDPENIILNAEKGPKNGFQIERTIDEFILHHLKMKEV